MSLLKVEIQKLLAKPRTYLSPALLVFLILLVFWGMAKEGEKVLSFAFQALEENFMVEGDILTGGFVSYLILNTLWIHVPILLVIVTGDLLGSEFESGSIRLMLTRPISRAKFILNKHFLAILYSSVFVLILFAFTIGSASIIFGEGDLLVFIEGLQVVPKTELSQRFVYAFLHSVLSMSCLGALSVCLGVFTKKSLTSILFTLGILILSTLIQTLGPSLFPGWEQFLLTYHFSQWQLFFQIEIPFNEVFYSQIWMMAFILFCVTISAFRFQTIKITE